jgi:hypothetical protein
VRVLVTGAAGFIGGAIRGLPADLAETTSSAAGITYWENSTRAERELGFSRRDLESGLRATFGG